MIHIWKGLVKLIHIRHFLPDMTFSFLYYIKKRRGNCIRFFLGYSGWDSEQLNNEIRENTWLVSEEEKSYLMKNNIKDMWRTALEKLGSKYETWSRFPQVPTLN